MRTGYGRIGNAHKAAAHYKRAFEYGLLRFGGDRGATRHESVVGVLDVRAAVHGRHANGARGGLVVEGARALTLSDQGKHEEAEEILHDVLAARRRVLGSAHPDTLSTVNCLESVHAKQTKPREPVRSKSKREKSTVAPLSPTHLADAEARSRAAEAEFAGHAARPETVSSQGKHAEAERSEREVLGVSRRVLGEKHPDTLGSASNLALSLARQGKLAEAEEILRATLVGQQRVLGNSHPDAGFWIA
jgi:hypothetical protein